MICPKENVPTRQGSPIEQSLNNGFDYEKLLLKNQTFTFITLMKTLYMYDDVIYIFLFFFQFVSIPSQVTLWCYFLFVCLFGEE